MRSSSRRRSRCVGRPFSVAAGSAPQRRRSLRRLRSARLAAVSSESFLPSGAAPPTAICRAASGARDDSHRAGNARAAEAAVASGVLAKILLVIVLGVIERRRQPDFGRNGAIAFLVERLLEHLLRALRGLELLIAMAVDRRAVLRADIVALAHALRRVMALPEHLEQF